MKSGDPGNAPRPGGESGADQVADLLPAYTLGALDDDQRRLVEEELGASQPLRDEQRRYQSTVDSLAASITMTKPPSPLRQRVISISDSEREPLTLADRRNRLGRVALWIAAALVLVLAGAVAALWSELNERDDEIADLQQASNRPSTNFSRPLVWTELSASQPGMLASGYFCRTEDGSVGWIVVEGMPVTAGEVYQLWLVDGDRHESAGMFVTDDEGRGFGVVRVGAPVTSFQQIWITIEPPGGSPAPTGEPRVSANIV